MEVHPVGDITWSPDGTTGTISYQVDWANYGPDVATGTTINGSAVAGYVWGSVTTVSRTGGGSFTANGGTSWTWSLGSVQPGATGSVVLKVQVARANLIAGVTESVTITANEDPYVAGSTARNDTVESDTDGYDVPRQGVGRIFFA